MAEGKVGDIKLSIKLNTSEAAKSLGAFVSVVNRSFKEIAAQAGIKINTADLDRLEAELRQIASAENEAAKSGEPLKDTFKKHREEADKTTGVLGKLKAGWQSVTQQFAVVGLAVAGVQKIVGFFQKTLGSLIHSSNVQEEAEARLTGALKIYGRYSREAVDDIKALAAERQKLTKFGDEETVSAAAFLETFDIEIDQLKEAIPLLQDLAVMTSKSTGQQADMESVAKMVGVALEGQVGLLRRAGVVVSDEYAKKIEGATSRSEKLAAIFDIIRYNAEGMAVAVGQTDSAAFTQLSNAIDEQKERLGDYLKSGLAPLVRKMAEMIGTQELESEKLVGEQANLTLNMAVLKSYADQEKLTAYELSNRNKIINELKANYPGYFQNINAEKSTYDEVAAAISRVNDNLLKKIRLAVYQEDIESLTKQQVAIEKQDEALRKQNYDLEQQIGLWGFQKAISDNAHASILTTGIEANKALIKNNENTLKKNREAWNNYANQISEIQRKINDTSLIEPPAPPSGGANNALTPEQVDAAEQVAEIEARRKGTAAEIAYWQERISKLLEKGDDPKNKLKILQYEEKITDLKSQQAAGNERFADDIQQQIDGLGRLQTLSESSASDQKNYSRALKNAMEAMEKAGLTSTATYAKLKKEYEGGAERIAELTAKQKGPTAEIAYWEGRIAEIRKTGDDPINKEKILEIEQKITALKREQADGTRDLTEETQKQIASLEYMKALSSLSPDDQKRYAEVLQSAIKAIEAEGKTATEVYAKLRRELGEVQKDSVQLLNNEQKALLGISRTVSSSFGSAFGEITSRSKNAAEAFEDAFNSAIASIGAQLAENALLLLLANMITGGTYSSTVGMLTNGQTTSLLRYFFGNGMAGGGYTGSGNDKDVAGVYHRNEFFFESGITKGNVRELAALRSAMQGGMKLKNLLQPVPLPVSAMVTAGGGVGGDSTAVLQGLKAVSTGIENLNNRIGRMRLTSKTKGKDLYHTVKIQEKLEARGKKE